MIDDFAEFIIKYKHNVEYPSRSTAVKIVEDAYKLVTEREAHIKTIETSNSALEEQVQTLNNTLQEVISKYQQQTKQLKSNVNELIRATCKLLDDKKRQDFASIIELINNIFENLDTIPEL